MDIQGHVTAVRQVFLGDETTADLLTGETVVPVADTADFDETGGHVLIAGEVYTYVSVVDGEDDDEQPSITLASGLLADVPTETPVETWSVVDGVVESEWKVEVTDDTDGSAGIATLTHSLIPMTLDGMPVDIGASVTVRIDDEGDWWVVEILGGAPGIDPGYFRTGIIQADVQVTVGTPGAQRVVVDGSPAIEAYDASNEQTVNIDGEENFMRGSIATAADGARIELGPGQEYDNPANEIRLYTDHGDEVAPGQVVGFVMAAGAEHRGVVQFSAPDWDAPGVTPELSLASATPSGAEVSIIDAYATEIALRVVDSVSVVGGPLHATMGGGSVGTGTFRDSVDARVTAGVPAATDAIAGKTRYATSAETAAYIVSNAAVTPAALFQSDLNLYNNTMAAVAAAYQPADATLTGIAATSPTADQLLYATGADIFATATLTSKARDLLDDVTAADMRTTILAASLRRAVNTQTGTSYTLVLTDEDKVVQVNNAATHTLTIPPDSSVAWVTGTEIEVFRQGAGAVTFAAGAGVTINSRGGLLSINGQFGVARLRKRGANTWVLSGDLV